MEAKPPPSLAVLLQQLRDFGAIYHRLEALEQQMAEMQKIQADQARLLWKHIQRSSDSKNSGQAKKDVKDQ